jgi:hypothetical protein
MIMAAAGQSLARRREEFPICTPNQNLARSNTRPGDAGARCLLDAGARGLLDAGRRRWRCSDAFGVRTCRYRPVILPVPAENENLDVFGRAFDDEIVVAKQPRCHARKRSLISTVDRTIECGRCMVVQIEPGAQCGKNIFKRSPVGFQAQCIRAAFNRHAGAHRHRNAASQAHQYEDRSEPSGSATMWRDHDLIFLVFRLGRLGPSGRQHAMRQPQQEASTTRLVPHGMFLLRGLRIPTGAIRNARHGAKVTIRRSVDEFERP